MRRDKNMWNAPLLKEPWEHLRVEVRCAREGIERGNFNQMNYYVAERVPVIHQEGDDKC